MYDRKEYFRRFVLSNIIGILRRLLSKLLIYNKMVTSEHLKMVFKIYFLKILKNIFKFRIILGLGQ